MSRRGYKEAYLLFACFTPSVSPTARQLPRQGAFWVRYKLQPKSCPRLRGKWHEVPKGEWLKEAKCREVFPLSLFTIVHRQLPRKRWSLLGALYKLTD